MGTRGFFFILLAVFVVAAGIRAAQGPAQNSAGLGRKLALDLTECKFDEVEAHFDERMSQAMPVEKLSAVWDSLLKQVGPFRVIRKVREEELQGFRAVIVTCEFEKAAVDVRFVFNPERKVAGLFFAPSRDNPEAGGTAPPAGWTGPPYANREAFRERSVTVGSGRWQLPGTLAIPSGAGPFPAVVLVHGSGPQDEDETIGPNKPFKDIAWGLASRGIAVLRYTKRTRKYGKQLSENPELFTVRDETVEDACAAAGLLAVQPEIDPRRIIVLGHSMGGMLAPRIAGADSRVSGLIIMAGSTRPLEDSVIEQLKYIAGLPGNNAEDAAKQIQAAEEAARQIKSPDLTPSAKVNMLGSEIPGSYFLDLRGYNPPRAAAQLKIPILILQGGRDYQVTMKDYEGWQQGLQGNPRVTFKLYSGLTHLFMAGSGQGAGPGTPADYARAGHVSVDVIADVTSWIKSLP